jgi:heme oxygenase
LKQLIRMILEKLKTETAQLHEEVEKDNLTCFIMDGTMDQPKYEILLRQNFMVYKAVEDFVNARYDKLPESLKPFAGYEKTNALANDISRFSSLPLPKPLIIVGSRDVATIIGKLYVIEGSMMGGMMLNKKIQACNNLSHITEHSFYNNHTQTNLSRWKSFKEAVATVNFNIDDVDKAISSAKATFNLFKEAYAIKSF